MPHVNNLNFPEKMFALSFLHTIEDISENKNINEITEHTS